MIQYPTSELAAGTFKPGSFRRFPGALVGVRAGGDTDVLPEVCITATVPHYPHGLEKPHPTSN